MSGDTDSGGHFEPITMKQRNNESRNRVLRTAGVIAGRTVLTAAVVFLFVKYKQLGDELKIMKAEHGKHEQRLQVAEKKLLIGDKKFKENEKAIADAAFTQGQLVVKFRDIDTKVENLGSALTPLYFGMVNAQETAKQAEATGAKLTQEVGAVQQELKATQSDVKNIEFIDERNMLTLVRHMVDDYNDGRGVLRLWKKGKIPQINDDNFGKFYDEVIRQGRLPIAKEIFDAWLEQQGRSVDRWSEFGPMTPSIPRSGP